VTDDGWEDLANAYADVLGLPEIEPTTQAVIGKRLARVFEEELQDVEKAEETYRYVLSVAARDAEALANLDRIYSSLEQWADLAAVLEQRAVVAAETTEQVELYTRLGQVYEEQLGQVDDAVRSFRRIFDDLDPANEEAIRSLARIYELKEAWVDLKGVYERQLQNAVGDVEEAEIRARMARLAADRLGNVNESIEGWKRVLDLRGEDPEALWALADLYERQGRWAELTDVLERHFDIADSDEERVNILTRRANLFLERLNRDDEALETWQRVLDIDFANVNALRAMAHIWRTRKDPQELVTVLHMTIDRAGAVLEPREVVEVYRELGRTYADVLSQPYEAAEAWRNLLEVDPRISRRWIGWSGDTGARRTGPRWSTSRSSARTRWRTGLRRCASCWRLRRSGGRRSRITTGPRRPSRRSSASRRTTISPSRSSRSSTPPRVAGSSWSSST
jgi:tetratricopeptide (TPR) repeat protein